MKHFQLKDFHKDNYRYFVEKPDRNFSAARNYAIINGTIEDYEKMRYGVDPKVVKAAGDRADILASFAKYKLDIGGGKQLEEWLGKEQMNRIYGAALLEKIKMFDSIRKLNKARGNDKYKDFYLK